jgi:hypothetical protein
VRIDTEDNGQDTGYKGQRVRMKPFHFGLSTTSGPARPAIQQVSNFILCRKPPISGKRARRLADASNTLAMGIDVAGRGSRVGACAEVSAGVAVATVLTTARLSAEMERA